MYVFIRKAELILHRPLGEDSNNVMTRMVKQVLTLKSNAIKELP